MRKFVIIGFAALMIFGAYGVAGAETARKKKLRKLSNHAPPQVNDAYRYVHLSWEDSGTGEPMENSDNFRLPSWCLVSGEGKIADGSARAVDLKVLFGDLDALRIKKIKLKSGDIGLSSIKATIPDGFKTVTFGFPEGETTTHYYDLNVNGFGAWMKHSAFFAIKQSARYSAAPDPTDTRIYHELGFGVVVGNPSNSSPSVSATYEGGMAGYNRYGALRGKRVTGDARVDFEATQPGEGEVAVRFTNIKGAAYPVNVNHSGLSVTPQGTFSTPGQSLKGSFYGDEHEEVAGTFHFLREVGLPVKVGIVGAFGAKRK